MSKYFDNPYIFWPLVIVGCLGVVIAIMIYAIENHYIKTVSMDVVNRTYHYTLGYSWKAPEVIFDGQLDEDCEGLVIDKVDRLVTMGKCVVTRYSIIILLSFKKDIGSFVLYEFGPDYHKHLAAARVSAQEQATIVSNLLRLPIRDSEKLREDALRPKAKRTQPQQHRRYRKKKSV